MAKTAVIQTERECTSSIIAALMSKSLPPRRTCPLPLFRVGNTFGVGFDKKKFPEGNYDCFCKKKKRFLSDPGPITCIVLICLSFIRSKQICSCSISRSYLGSEIINRHQQCRDPMNIDKDCRDGQESALRGRAHIT